MGLFGDILGGFIGVGNYMNQATANQQNYQLGLQQLDWNKKSWEQSYNFGLDQFNYQKQQNLLTQSREDNAVQRRVADLKAAGLSPTLAAGSPAGATTVSTAGSVSPGNYQAPQKQAAQMGSLGSMDGIISLLTMKKNFEKMDYENQVLQAQKSNIEAQTKNTELQTEFLPIVNAIRLGEYGNDVKDLASRLDLNDAQLSKIVADISATTASTALTSQNLKESMYNYDKYSAVGVPTNAPASVKTATSGFSAAKQLWDKIGNFEWKRPDTPKEWKEKLRKRGFTESEIEQAYQEYLLHGGKK